MKELFLSLQRRKGDSLREWKGGIVLQAAASISCLFVIATSRRRKTTTDSIPAGNLKSIIGMLQLKNKTALVTGGGTGIGQSIALHLAQEGCHLVLTGLGIDDLNKTKEMC